MELAEVVAEAEIVITDKAAAITPTPTLEEARKAWELVLAYFITNKETKLEGQRLRAVRGMNRMILKETGELKE